MSTSPARRSTARPWPSWPARRARAACSCARSPAARPRPTSRSCRTRKLNRGDIVTLVGRTQDIAAATKMLGYPDRADRRRRRGLHRRGDHDRRAARRAGLQGRQRAADAVHLRRRADRRPVLRLAALGAPDLRADSIIDRVVHELGRPQRVHRRRRHLVRTGLCRRAAEARLQPVPVGRRGDDGAADPGDVRRQIPVPLRRCHPARLLLRCAHDDSLARHDQ